MKRASMDSTFNIKHVETLHATSLQIIGMIQTYSLEATNSQLTTSKNFSIKLGRAFL
jgi:hypothetical protein